MQRREGEWRGDAEGKEDKRPSGLGEREGEWRGDHPPARGAARGG